MQPYPKILRKLCLCAATRKRQVAPERLLQTRSAFTKSVMVSMGVSKLGRMVQSRPDARVKINGAYYREVLLTQKLLSVMREICGQFFYLPARRWYCLSSVRDNQPSETRHLRSFYHTLCRPTAQTWTRLTIKYGRNAASSWRRWTEAVLDRCLAWFWSKCHQWRRW